MDHQYQYNKLSVKITSYFDLQKSYIKDRKQSQLIALKVLESEIKEIINPKKKVQQSTLDWLAQ